MCRNDYLKHLLNGSHSRTFFGLKMFWVKSDWFPQALIRLTTTTFEKLILTFYKVLYKGV